MCLQKNIVLCKKIRYLNHGLFFWLVVILEYLSARLFASVTHILAILKANGLLC